MFTEKENEILQKAKNILYRKAKTNKVAFTDPKCVKDYLTLAHILNEPLRESFRVLFLDSQHRLIKDDTLFLGTIDASPVYPRVVVSKALECNAAAVIFSHNHPSGVAEPSRADKSITEHLIGALKLVDIKVLDHIIVGEIDTVSFAERGWL